MKLPHKHNKQPNKRNTIVAAAMSLVAGIGALVWKKQRAKKSD